MGQRQILPNPRIGAGFVRRSVKRCNGSLRLTRKCQRQSIIRRIEHVARCLEHRHRFVIFALRNGHQRQLQHHLRLIGQQAQRIAIGAFGRGEPTGAEISSAKQGAEAGIVGRIAHCALGKRYGSGIIASFKRGLGAGRDADVRFVDLVAENRRALGDMRTRCRASREGTNHPDGSERSSETQRRNHHKFPSLNCSRVCRPVHCSPCRRVRACRPATRRVHR